MYGMFTNMLFRPEENFRKQKAHLKDWGRPWAGRRKDFFDVFERLVLQLTSAHTVLFVCVEVISSCLRTRRWTWRTCAAALLRWTNWSARRSLSKVASGPTTCSISTTWPSRFSRSTPRPLSRAGPRASPKISYKKLYQSLFYLS